MRSRLVLVAIVLVTLGIAWAIRFGCDDAYITFNYARSLVRGDGLTWFGEPIEGYTNFSWVLWSAVGHVAGVDPLIWAWLGSLAATIAVVVVVYRIGTLRSGTTVAALAACGALGLNFTFTAFATSGLETMLQCALLAALWLAVEKLRRAEAIRRTELIGTSIVVALALWTRLDSAVLIAPLGIVALHTLIKRREAWPAYVALLAPAGLIVGGWLAWKLSYYGDIVPNTFHAKAHVSAASVRAAAAYAFAFLHSYMLWPVLLLVAIDAIVRRSFTARLPAVLVVTWFAYVVFVGGDFMEFRFFVPAMPPLFVLVAESLVRTRPLRGAALIAVLATFSWRHAATFDGAANHFYDSIGALRTFYGAIPDHQWDRIGRPLRTLLDGSGATIATGGAGSLPYFAELPTLDQLGLNDAWIARNGHRGIMRPGHQRHATWDYMVERKVTFVIDSQTLIERGSFAAGASPVVRGWFEVLILPIVKRSARPPKAITLVAAPIDDHFALLMLYLTQTPEMTARITAQGWEMAEIRLPD